MKGNILRDQTKRFPHRTFNDKIKTIFAVSSLISGIDGWTVLITEALRLFTSVHFTYFQVIEEAEVATVKSEHPFDFTRTKRN